jgi:hypothetical protein
MRITDRAFLSIALPYNGCGFDGNAGTKFCDQMDLRVAVSANILQIIPYLPGKVQLVIFQVVKLKIVGCSTTKTGTVLRSFFNF